jgi:transposase
VTRKSVTGIFLKLRRRLAEECERLSPALVLRLRNEHSLSGIRCLCGRCGEGSSLKSPVFAIVAEKGKVFGKEIPDCRKPSLRAIIRRSIGPNPLPVDSWQGYDALVDPEFSRPFLIHHVANPHLSSERTRDVERFWGFARQRLLKFNGVPNRTFYLHLKESEWRFNLRGTDLYSELLKLFEKNPL